MTERERIIKHLHSLLLIQLGISRMMEVENNDSLFYKYLHRKLNDTTKLYIQYKEDLEKFKKEN